MMCAFSRETETGVASLIDSEEDEIVLAARTKCPPVAGTRSGQQYLKKYDETVPSSSKPTKEPAKQSTKQLVDKQKELQYTKSLQKDKAKGSSMPFRFDILAQLANIPTRIILLRLSKSTREAPREALVDSEAFITIFRLDTKRMKDIIPRTPSVFLA